MTGDKRAQSASPEPTRPATRLRNEDAKRTPQFRAATPTFLGLPRELRNMIYDQLLAPSVPLDLRQDNPTIHAELDRSCFTSCEAHSKVRGQASMQPAYLKDFIPLLHVNHQIKSEFSQITKPRPHLFVTFDVDASPPVTESLLDACLDAGYWKNGMISQTTHRLPKDLRPSVLNLRIRFDSTEDTEAADLEYLFDNLVNASNPFSRSFDLDKTYIEVIVSDQCAIGWKSSSTAPNLTWMCQGAFSGSIRLYGLEMVSTVLTSRDVVIYRGEGDYRSGRTDKPAQSIYIHPGWKPGEGWQDGADYRTCFFRLEGRTRPTYSGSAENVDPLLSAT